MAIAIQEMKHGSIDPDPNNPRQLFSEAGLQELGTDLSVRGMLQPMMVRPHPTKKGRHMIVFGERRWRAAGLVGLETVPVIVRDMSDLDVLEAQIAENDKRSDVHPLEEADAYRRLHQDHGRDIEEIAELTGKSKAYVYAAMKLCALGKEARQAFLAGKLDKSRALLIARLPTSQQKQATGEISDRDPEDPVSFRDAASHIRRNYMLRLADAPFKVGDGLLIEKAGPCTTCPKRTGNQQELFADVLAERGGADLCTDGKCYQEKVDAHWLRVKNEAEASGREVLEGKEGEQAGSYGDKKLIDLDTSAHGVDPGKSWREVLGKHAEQAVTAVARDHDEIKELISRNDLPTLLKEAGIKAPKNGHAAPTSADDEYKKRNQLERLVTATIIEAVHAKADEPSLIDGWKLIARMVVRACGNDAHRAVLAANNLKATAECSARQTLLAWIGVELKTVVEVRNFMIDLLVRETHGWLDEKARGIDYDDDKDGIDRRTNLEDAAELLGIDVDAIVKKVKADIAAAEKAKAEKKSKPTSAEATS